MPEPPEPPGTLEEAFRLALARHQGQPTHPLLAALCGVVAAHQQRLRGLEQSMSGVVEPPHHDLPQADPGQPEDPGAESPAEPEPALLDGIEQWVGWETLQQSFAGHPEGAEIIEGVRASAEFVLGSVRQSLPPLVPAFETLLRLLVRSLILAVEYRGATKAEGMQDLALLGILGELNGRLVSIQQHLGLPEDPAPEDLAQGSGS